MRLHRFFLSSNINKEIINSFSSDGLVHQLRSVFRFHEGSRLVFFDGSGKDYVSEIVSLGRDAVTFRVIEERAVKPFSDLKLALVFSLIKKDNMEWIMEKGTELGVSAFVPLVSERSEKKGFNMDRARKIIIEACEQSGRADVPTIAEPQSLSNYLSSIGDSHGKFLVFHTDGEDFKKEGMPRQGEVTVCIGPEGGWSQNEVALFKEKNATVVKLNTPVLRAETAAIAIPAILLS